MVKDYNKTVREVFGRRTPAGEVGLEIEVEGRGLIQGAVPPYWFHHRDDSLRGEENAEYVLSQPIPRQDVESALNVLFKALDKNGSRLRNDSPNTSVHVHLNVNDWTIKKVYNLIVLWYIFEQSLMDWCGDERVGNHFCLRGCDAEAQLQRLASAIRYNELSRLNDLEGLRYTAMNFTALAKFGSLEFRGFPGVYETESIHTWVRMLLSLKDYAEKFDSPPEVIAELSRVGIEDFFKSALNTGLWRLLDQKTYKQQLRDGMRLVQNVAYVVNWEKDKKKTEEKKKDEPEVEHEVMEAPGEVQPWQRQDINNIVWDPVDGRWHRGWPIPAIPPQAVVNEAAAPEIPPADWAGEAAVGANPRQVQHVVGPNDPPDIQRAGWNDEGFPVWLWTDNINGEMFSRIGNWDRVIQPWTRV